MATLKPGDLLARASFVQEEEQRQQKLKEIKKEERRHKQAEARKSQLEEKESRGDTWALVSAAAEAEEARKKLMEINQQQGTGVKLMSRKRFEGRIQQKQDAVAQEKQVAKANKKLDRMIYKTNAMEQQEKQDKMAKKRQQFATAPASAFTPTSE